MELSVGEMVDYGSHGAGPITAREVRGEEQVVVVLSLAHGLSVELPLARAEELLRSVADAEEIARLGYRRAPGERVTSLRNRRPHGRAEAAL
jgi:RNA polymerase-interacting CarD/CdnL/TRCF family regulator